MDSEEVPVTPTRRSSRRIQAKAELKTREITPEPEPVKSTRRSRSRSVTRNLSAEKENVEERPTFQIVEEEVNEEAVIKVKEHKSPARKRGGRSRSITPTRIIPTRAATKSPAREPSTPVRLTRAARRQGYGTPDQSEQAKLVIAESPQTSVSPAPKLTKEQLVIVKTPTLILEDVLTSKTPMIQRFLKNWKGSQLNESVQEEPMEVSYAEEVDTEFRDRTEEEKGQGCRLDERREETEEVPESNGQNVQTMDMEETVGEKSEKIEPTEKVVMETVTLCKSRVLKMEYSPPIELPEKTTYSSQEQEGENESRTESHKPVMVAETVQEEEKSTMTDSIVVLAETTVAETETENSIEHPEQTEGHHEVVLFQEDHRSEQRTTLADVLSTSEEEKKLERAEDAEPIEDENENEQSTESQEPSAEPEPTGEETEIGDSYEVREGTEEENVASPSEEDGTEHPCRNLRQALNLVWEEGTYSVFTRSNGKLIPAPVLSQTAVRQDFHSDARQIKDEPVSAISFRKIGARESAPVNEESRLVKSETVELEETDSEQETDGQENALRLKEIEHNLNATEQETMTLLAQFDQGVPAQIYVLDKNGQPVSKVSSPLAGSEERVTERQDERDSIGQETEIPSSEEAGAVSPQDSHSSPKEDVEQEDIGKHLPSEEALVLDEITQVSEAPKTEKRKKKKKRLERDEEENNEKILNEDQGDEPATVPVLEEMAENTEVPKVEKRKKKKRKEAVEEEKTVTEKIEVEKQVAFEEAPILEKKRRAVADEPLDFTEVSESVETLEEPAVFESQEGEGLKSEKRKKKRTVLEDTPELGSQENSLAVEKLEQVAQSIQIKKKKKKRAAVKEALEEQENLADTPVPQSEEVIELEKKKKKKRKALPEQAPISEVVEAQDEVKPIFVGEKPKKKKKVLTESNTEKEPELEPKVSKKEKKHKRKVQEDSQEPRINKKNGKKTEKMVDLDEEASSGISYPEVTLKRMFNNPKEVSTELKDLLQSLYAWNNRLEKRADDLPDRFLNDDSETIWQFINHKNRQINKDWRKYKNLLDEPAAIDGLDLSDDEEAEDEEEEPLDEDFEDDDELVADEEEAEENEEDEEQNVDLFNLKDEDLKDLERELEAEHDSGEGTSDEREKENDRPRRTKKYPKSAVDDKFFNLAEMDAFCDEAEKQDDEEGLLATVDDTWGGPANYRYEDFFGKLDDVVGSRGGEDKKGKKRKVEASVSKDAKKKKSVRFALDEGEEEEEELENEEEEAEENGKPALPVLLGQSKEDEKLESKLKTDIRKLQESIRRLEEENLEPRTWELSGEVTAQQRSENELLETHLQFDNANKRAPEVTEDFTEKLEAMIKQRIRDQAFDDVIRIKKVDEKVDIYRNDAIEEQEMMKKSLAEVYEKDYQKAAGETAAAATENPVHKGIQEKVDRLFHLIDAMSHFEYAPPSVRPEIKVVSNMAALRVEEVGMQASTDAQLLAPEEMKKKQKGELKAGDERSKTDKLRERRKKKTKQRAMVMKVGAEKALAGQLAAKIKKTKVPKADKEENLKSSNFFSKLQDTVQKEIKEKTTKKKKVKSQKVATGGSKFKL